MCMCVCVFIDKTELKACVGLCVCVCVFIEKTELMHLCVCVCVCVCLLRKLGSKKWERIEDR